MSLPVNLILEKNRIDAKYPWLVLVKFTLNEGESDEVVRRFVKDNPDLTFDGEVYQGFNFDIGFIEQSSEGKIPSTSLAICNVTQYLQGTLEDYDGATGGVVTIILVHADKLEEDYSELELNFDVIFTHIDKKYIQFKLGVPSPLRRRFPLHRHLPDKCPYKFGGARCGYTGGDLTCARTYAACREKENQARYGGDVGEPANS